MEEFGSRDPCPKNSVPRAVLSEITGPRKTRNPGKNKPRPAFWPEWAPNFVHPSQVIFPVRKLKNLFGPNWVSAFLPGQPEYPGTLKGKKNPPSSKSRESPRNPGYERPLKELKRVGFPELIWMKSFLSLVNFSTVTMRLPDL